MSMSKTCLNDRIKLEYEWTMCAKSFGLIRTRLGLQSSHSLVLASKFEQAYNGLFSIFMWTQFMSKVYLNNGLMLDHMCVHL